MIPVFFVSRAERRMRFMPNYPQDLVWSGNIVDYSMKYMNVWCKTRTLITCISNGVWRDVRTKPHCDSKLAPVCKKRHYERYETLKQNDIRSEGSEHRAAGVICDDNVYIVTEKDIRLFRRVGGRLTGILLLDLTDCQVHVKPTCWYLGC